MKINEDAMIAALLGTDPELAHRAHPAERARIRSILRNILPVSDRVVFHPIMSWAEVLELYAKTKIVVSTLSTGGSAPEAGSRV